MYSFVTYADLVTRYGKNQASDLLASLEKLAQIKKEIICLDEEARLREALMALENINFAN